MTFAWKARPAFIWSLGLAGAFAIGAYCNELAWFVYNVVQAVTN